MSDSRLVVVGISGSPSSPSKSRALLCAALDACEADGAETHVIERSSLPSDALLGRGDRFTDTEPASALLDRLTLLVRETSAIAAAVTGAAPTVTVQEAYT